MKKYIALFLVILMFTSFVGCANAVYKRGVNYSSFPEDDDLIYDDAIVFSYEEKRDEVQLEYGSKDDVDDIMDHYQDEFDDDDYVIYEEEVDKDEYKVKGRTDEWEFDIEVEEAPNHLSEFYDTVVTIELEEIESEKDDSDEDESKEIKDTSSTDKDKDSSQDKDNNPKDQSISNEQIFYDGIKALTLRQLDNMNSNMFEGIFLSSLYDQLNSSSYNMNFTADTVNHNGDETMDIYMQTAIAQEYGTGEGSMNFSMGEDRDNTFTNSMYFSGPNCYIKKSDPEIPIRRYTSSRDGDYFADTTFQQRLYATFGSRNSSKTAKEEYAPMVDGYINLLRNYIDDSVLSGTKSSLLLLDNEIDCYTISATLEGAAGYEAIDDLFFTMRDDINMQHIFGYIIYGESQEGYKENTISAICSVIGGLTDDEIDDLELSIEVVMIDDKPVGFDLRIATQEKSMDYSILEYVNGAETQKHTEYQAFDGSYNKNEEWTLEINEGEYESYAIISSENKKTNEKSYYVIETYTVDNGDTLDNEVVITGDQTSAEDGSSATELSLNWYIQKLSTDSYSGSGIMYMKQDTDEDTNTMDGDIQMTLDFTNDVLISPITYIDEVGTSVSTNKDLFIEMVGLEEELQNDITSRFLAQMLGFFISYL